MCYALMTIMIIMLVMIDGSIPCLYEQQSFNKTQEHNVNFILLGFLHLHFSRNSKQRNQSGFGNKKAEMGNNKKYICGYGKVYNW